MLCALCLCFSVNVLVNYWDYWHLEEISHDAYDILSDCCRVVAAFFCSKLILTIIAAGCCSLFLILICLKPPLSVYMFAWVCICVWVSECISVSFCLYVCDCASLSVYLYMCVCVSLSAPFNCVNVNLSMGVESQFYIEMKRTCPTWQKNFNVFLTRFQCMVMI